MLAEHPMLHACGAGLKIDGPALEAIVEGSNHDIRQVLNHMQVWCDENKKITYDQAKEKAWLLRQCQPPLTAAQVKSSQKNIHLSPFDVVGKFFSASGAISGAAGCMRTHGRAEAQKMNLDEKIDLFFNDYSLAPLFVQEMYLASRPNRAHNLLEQLDAVASAADAISDGDIIGRTINQKQQFSLLPLHAVMSCIRCASFSALLASMAHVPAGRPLLCWAG